MKIKNFLALLGVVTICSSCIGDSTTGNPTISAIASGVCKPMTSSTCQVTLSYNTGGASNLSLGYTSTPQNYSQFNISSGLSTCTIGNMNTQQTCTFTIGYTVGQPSQTETVVFTLGSASSGPIVIGN